MTRSAGHSDPLLFRKLLCRPTLLLRWLFSLWSIVLYPFIERIVHPWISLHIRRFLGFMHLLHKCLNCIVWCVMETPSTSADRCVSHPNDRSSHSNSSVLLDSTNIIKQKCPRFHQLLSLKPRNTPDLAIFHLDDVLFTGHSSHNVKLLLYQATGIEVAVFFFNKRKAKAKQASIIENPFTFSRHHKSWGAIRVPMMSRSARKLLFTPGDIAVDQMFGNPRPRNSHCICRHDY
jgi:hypothetical protein